MNETQQFNAFKHNKDIAVLPQKTKNLVYLFGDNERQK
jgi:hypothetical protein